MYYYNTWVSLIISSDKRSYNEEDEELIQKGMFFLDNLDQYNILIKSISSGIYYVLSVTATY